MPIDIAKQIKKYRLQAGLSINKAARLAGVDWARWNRWEKGTSKPSIDLLDRIAETLDCTPADLVS